MPQAARPRKVTLKDIAQEADVSIAAVSKALSGHPQISNETKQRVKQISDRLQYRPRRRRGVRPSPRAQRLALLVVGSTSPPPYLMHLIDHVKSASQRGGNPISLEVTTIADGEDEANIGLIDDLAASVDGIFMDGAVSEALFRRVSALPIPSVMLGNVGGDPLMQYDVGLVVATDIRAMGCMATRRLLAAGKRRIAFICSRIRSNFWFDQWYQGYRHAHVEAGVPLEQDLFMPFPGGRPGGRAAEAILQSSRFPDGYVIPDFTTASQLVVRMALAGQALDPQSLIYAQSYGESDHPELAPFFALDANIMRISRTALNILRLSINGELKPPLKIIVPFREVVGQSDTSKR